GRHGWRELRDPGAALVLHVRRLEALGLRRSQPARPRRDQILHQDQDRHRALALRHQGRRRVRDPDDAVRGLSPAIASGAMTRNATSAPSPSTIAPPISAGNSPAATAAPSVGFAPARLANNAPSTATPSVAPTMRAVFTMPEAAPAWSFDADDTATVSAGPVLRPRPMPIMTQASSIQMRLVSADTKAS